MSEIESGTTRVPPFDMDGVFRRGGRELVDLLEYLVLSLQMDPVFLFLVSEFRLKATALRAVALYDVFCARNAPARVSAVASVPPRDVRLAREVAALRGARERATEPRINGASTRDSSDSATPLNLRPPLAAPKYLFDAVAREVATATGIAAIAAIQQRYDPKRTPHENLPGGRLTTGQRAFVDQVWEPRLRPYLVASGFRRIANIA